MKISPFSKTYENRCVLDFPEMELLSGNIYAIIGANGSGKSTFGKIISGILAADHKKTPISGFSIGYMPQKSYAFRMNTKANILLNGNNVQRAGELMDALNIRSLENKRADKLSGGETARMALARLMMKNYDLVILDEPTAAMDMETTILSEQMMVSYAKDSCCALILITHSLQQAKRIADEVWYFHKGTLMEYGPKSQVLNAPQKAETKQFLEFYGM